MTNKTFNFLFGIQLKTGKCSHQTAYKYFAESIHSKQPLQGYYCDSLIDIKIGNCTAYGQKTIMGGEPGAKQQYVDNSWRKLHSFYILQWTIFKNRFS